MEQAGVASRRLAQLGPGGGSVEQAQPPQAAQEAHARPQQRAGRQATAKPAPTSSTWARSPRGAASPPGRPQLHRPAVAQEATAARPTPVRMAGLVGDHVL